MVENLTKLSQLLKLGGSRLTVPRKLVLEALSEEEPISMHALIQKIGNKADRASIYRTVKLYEDLGIIQRINYGWKYKLELTDKFNVHHHHMSCTKCGKVIEINENSIENFISRTAGENGFVTISHQIEIQGYCSTCAA
ncbi:MAG TPA: Fur family transcriptional regulator [Candidatus Saccharimonadales bacterium]|nr:Fur family transcriptional regulator [Candidatus Saccharimonadales bacterium]